MDNDIKIRITIEKGEVTLAHSLCEAATPQVFGIGHTNLRNLEDWYYKNVKELTK